MAPKYMKSGERPTNGLQNGSQAEGIATVLDRLLLITKKCDEMH